MPRLTGTGQTQPTRGSRSDSADSSPARAILPPPSTSSPRLPLILHVSAAATEAGDSSRQGCAGPAPRAGHHLCDLPVADTIHHSARHLGGSGGSSLVGTPGSTSTCLIRRTCQKHFSLPYTTFTAAVILYDAIYSTPSKPISVFTAK